MSSSNPGHVFENTIFMSLMPANQERQTASAGSGRVPGVRAAEEVEDKSGTASDFEGRFPGSQGSRAEIGWLSPIFPGSHLSISRTLFQPGFGGVDDFGHLSEVDVVLSLYERNPRGITRKEP